MRRRGSKKGPSNINQYLKEEAENKKVKIVEDAEGMRTEIPLYMLGPEDKLNSIRRTTADLQHKNSYFNAKVEDRLEHLDHQEKHLNLQNRLKTIQNKEIELNRIVKPKKGK